MTHNVEVRTNWGIRGAIDSAGAGARKLHGSPEGLMNIFNIGDNGILRGAL